MSSFDLMLAGSKDKIFTISNKKFPELKQITLPDRRYYLDSEGIEYESVTTFIGRHSDKSAIDDWIARVGKEKADKITERAAKRGTQCHECIEDYLLGKKLRHIGGIGRGLFNKMKPLLNKIETIHGIECQLASKKFKLAGTSDCIGVYNGKLSIIDFKTSLRDKRVEWIDGYFIQATIYAIMYYELFGTWIDQIVILIGVEDSYVPQEFIANTKDYLPKIKDMIAKDMK